MNSYIIKSNEILVKTEFQTIISLLMENLKECYEKNIIVSEKRKFFFNQKVIKF